MASRCGACQHFKKADGFNLCSTCRSVRDTGLLGVDEHGFKADNGGGHRFKSGPAADAPGSSETQVRRSCVVAEQGDKPPGDVPEKAACYDAYDHLWEPLADWERKLLEEDAERRLAEARVNVGGIVQSACEGAKSTGQRPVKRRWWKRR